MNGILLILVLFAFISWLYYLKSQHRKYFYQSKDEFIRDILNRYPTAEGLEKMVQSDEWTKLMDVYGKPPSFDNRLSVFIVAGLGILALCVSAGATIITVYVDTELIYAAVMVGAIGIGLLFNAILLRYYLKKWNL